MKVKCPRCGKKVEFTLRCPRCGREFCKKDITEYEFLGFGKCPYCGKEVRRRNRVYSR